MIVPASQIRCFFVHRDFFIFEGHSLTLEKMNMDDAAEILFDACSYTIGIDAIEFRDKRQWLEKCGQWAELETDQYYYVLHPEQEIENEDCVLKKRKI